MLVLSNPQVVQETAIRWKKESKIAFVPTMGCLHDGHLALVRKAKSLGRRVIVSIFVNPLQFGPSEDFEKYPRSFEEDRAKLEAEGVDLIFNPDVKDLYPSGFSAKVGMGSITNRLCGKYRPGHFDGVATVCLKLFEITQADFAIFGEKDFQQLRIIQNMTCDLNLPVTIVPHTTVREEDGLALSSRNKYLNPEERSHAAVISRVLSRARSMTLQNAETLVLDIKQMAENEFSKTPLKIQYIEVTESKELQPVDSARLVHGVSLPHLFIAAFAGTTRLIDNVSLNGDHLQ